VIFWLVSWTGIWRLLGGMDARETFSLPEYEFKSIRN